MESRSTTVAPKMEPAIEPVVGIVVVNYNCLQDTLRCLDSLKQLDYGNFFTIVVDNCSPDGSGEYLSFHLPSPIQVLCSPENKGFAAGNNIGIRQALLMGASYLWLLNPDTEVEPNALRTLVDEMECQPAVAAAGSKILYAPQEAGVPRQIWGAGGSIDRGSCKVSMRGNAETDHGQFDSAENVGYLPGCSLLVRASVVGEIGYLPEEYFMYFEETDWCQQMREHGHALRYVPGSVVYHHFSDDKMQSPFTVYYYNRNERLFWSRWSGASKKIFWKTAFRDLPQALKAFGAARSPYHRILFAAHVRSCWDYLFRRFGRAKLLS